MVSFTKLDYIRISIEVGKLLCYFYIIFTWNFEVLKSNPCIVVAGSMQRLLTFLSVWSHNFIILINYINSANNLLFIDS